MTTVINSLPAKPMQALEALSVYRFLTVEQFVRLGIGSSAASVRKNVLPKLHRQKPALAKKRKLGQFLPEVHFLTEAGARYLSEAYKLPVEMFPYPKGQVQFGEMFARHRFAQIDFHIGFRQWAAEKPNIDLLFTDMDFDSTGSRRHQNFVKKTEIMLPHSSVPVVPDGLFGIKKNGNPMIFALEIHRTTQTKAVTTQIKRYMEVLETGAVATKYGLQTAPLICSVHMQDNVLRGVKTALMQTRGFDAFKGAFLFNTFEQIKSEITHGWTFADNSKAQPFPRRCSE